MAPESGFLENSSLPDEGLALREGLLENSLLETHRAAVQQALYLPEKIKSPEIDAETFQQRLEELLEGTHNPSLKAGLTILRGILIAHPDQLFENEIDKHDGAQTIFAILHSWVEGNMEEIFPKIQSECPEIRPNMDNFTMKHLINASPEVLMILYLSQLTHIAYHIIRYNYQPVEEELILQGQKMSTLAMSLHSSLFAISPDGMNFLAKYYRLGVRDSSTPNQNLSIHSGKLKYFSIKRGDRFTLPKGYRIGNYANFSGIIILATKQGNITPEESTFMQDNMTHASTVLCKKELKEMIELHNHQQIQQQD